MTKRTTFSRAPGRVPIELIARCVACKHEADVAEARDTPLCPKCFSPMVVVKARTL